MSSYPLLWSIYLPSVNNSWDLAITRKLTILKILEKSEYQTFWIQIRPNILSGLTWVQTVLQRLSADVIGRQRGYQEMTLAYKELNILII